MGRRLPSDTGGRGGGASADPLHPGAPAPHTCARVKSTEAELNSPSLHLRLPFRLCYTMCSPGRSSAPREAPRLLSLGQSGREPPALLPIPHPQGEEADLERFCPEWTKILWRKQNSSSRRKSCVAHSHSVKQAPGISHAALRPWAPPATSETRAAGPPQPRPSLLGGKASGNTSPPAPGLLAALTHGPRPV